MHCDSNSVLAKNSLSAGKYEGNERKQKDLRDNDDPIEGRGIFIDCVNRIAIAILAFMYQWQITCLQGDHFTSVYCNFMCKQAVINMQQVLNG